MRMVDADEIRKKAVPHTRGDHGYSADIRKWAVLVGDIDDAPTIDAVPVVRCKECKHYHAKLGWCDEHSHFIDEDRDFCYPHESAEWKMFEPDYFCADGERKDGDGNG